MLTRIMEEKTPIQLSSLDKEVLLIEEKEEINTAKQYEETKPIKITKQKRSLRQILNENTTLRHGKGGWSSLFFA